MSAGSEAWGGGWCKWKGAIRLSGSPVGKLPGLLGGQESGGIVVEEATKDGAGGVVLGAGGVVLS
ncbi:MAG: hypothetical protein AAF591_10660, partial [Verrucomicrobiota bacterium]